MAPVTHTPAGPLTGLPGGHSHKTSPCPENTCRLDGQTPMPPQQHCKGKVLVHWSTVRTESALLLLNLRFDSQSEPPFQHPGINFPWEAEQCNSLQHLRANLIHNWHLAWSFWTTSATSTRDIGEASTESSNSASSVEDVLVGLVRFLKVLFSLLNNIPSQCQQFLC